MQDAAFRTPADVRGIVAFLQPGGRVVVLLGPPGSGKTGLLAEILAALPGHAIHVANPLASPLTAGRVLLQIGGESTAEEDSDAIVHCLAAQREGPGPATLAIDDAQTLDADMLQVLPRLPGLRGENTSGMNLVLSADAAWWHALPDDMNAALKDPAHAMVVTLGEAVGQHPALVAVRDVATVVPGAGRRSRSAVSAICVVLLMGAAALVFRPGASRQSLDTLSVTPVAAAPEPGSAPPSIAAAVPAAVATVAEPAPKAADPGPATLPSGVTDPPPSESQLRADFAAFLGRAGRDTASLTPEAAEALFREYLAWRAGSGAKPAHADQAGNQP